jgi:hypothetical protein
MTNRDFWNDFQAGVARAEADLPALAADLLLLPRIVAEPAARGLDTAGKLAGYLARIAEAAAHDPCTRRGAGR